MKVFTPPKLVDLDCGEDLLSDGGGCVGEDGGGGGSLHDPSADVLVPAALGCVL